VETVWCRYGEAQAINLGDALLYLAFELVRRLDASLPRRDAAASLVLEETFKLIDGQDQEFAMRDRPRPTLEEYFRMVEGKTSALFSLPMAGAAELCGAGAEVTRALAEAARHLGVLFQIQDDLVDLYGDKGRGRQGGDLREGKPSMLVVHASHHGSFSDVRQLQELLKKREDLEESDVDEAKQLFRRTGSLRFAVAEIERRRQRALELEGLAEQPRLRSLIQALAEICLAPILGLLAEHKEEP